MSTEPNTEATPLLSVIIGMPGDNSEALLEVIKSIAAQSIADRIEVIVCAAEKRLVRLPPEPLEPLGDVRLLEVGPFRTFADGIVHGIFDAKAEVVVLFEDHAFAAPGWAEAIVSAHGRGYTAVGPSMENANPYTGRSWSHLLYDYGRFLRGEPSGEKADLPGHNSSYRRDALTCFDRARLTELVGRFELHAELLRRGHRLYLSGDAVCWHQNPSKLLASVWIRFAAHRHRAGVRARAERWSVPRRMLYATLSPLIPAVRVYDVFRNLARQHRFDLLRPRIVLAACGLSVANGVGECVGFLIGPGDIDADLAEFEFARHRQMAAVDLDRPPVGAAHLRQPGSVAVSVRQYTRERVAS